MEIINPDSDDAQSERENYEPQYYKYREYAKPKDQVVYPIKSSCGVTKENYKPGVLQPGCPYRNPSGVVDIPSVG